MRRIFFLSLALLVCAAGISLAAVRLQPAEIPGGDGETELTVLADGRLRSVTMAAYLPGVVAAEMPASFEPEALKAQAVAARTFILRRAAQRPDAHPEADVCSDPNCCCAWSGEEALRAQWGTDARRNLRKIRAAVAATDGEILTWEGEPILAAFHSASLNRTESSEALWGPVPYLVSVSTPETAEEAPNLQTEVTISPEELRAALDPEDAARLPDDPGEWSLTLTRDAAGRVERLSLGDVTLTGPEARSRFSLRSTAFTAEFRDGVFVFEVSGSGHGVGMSQYGANVMAERGSDYAEILAHYYPGAALR